MLELKQFIIFHIGNQECATALEGIREIVLMAELSVPLSRSEFHAGMLNYGGEAIPVYHLSRILGLPDVEAGLYSHIVLARTAGSTIGFITQAVSRIGSFSKEAISPLSEESSMHFAASGMLIEGRSFIAILSLEKLVAHVLKARNTAAAHEMNLLKEVS